MKSKKGFTILEILAVIVIIATVTAITVPSIFKITDKARTRLYCSKLEMVQKSAERYADDNSLTNICEIDSIEYGCETITIQDLINGNYIDSDGLNGAFLDPRDNLAINTTGLIVYEKNNRSYAYIADEDCPSLITSALSPNELSNVKHTVTFTLDGGTWSGTSPITLREGATLYVNDPVKAHYSFVRWNVTGNDSDINDQILTMGLEDTVLTATWLLDSYTLTVNANGGTWSGTTPQTINYNATATIANPTRTGYTFAGWTVSGTGSTIVGTTFTMGTANSTLTANWTINSYTLTVNANSGTWGGTTPQTINYNATATIANPTRTGYTFAGWTPAGTGSTIVGTTFTMGTANATLTANWTINSYTLTVNANSGTWGGTTPQTINYNATATIANPTRTDYVFNGWTVTGTGSSIVGTTFTMGSANTTLTANWVPASLTLTVNANGGTWSGTTPQSIAPAATATIAYPTRSGYVFTGWTVSGTGSTIVGTTFTMGTADTTITANWVAYASMYTYTGTSTVIDDGSGNWRIKFLTSGTFTPLVNMAVNIHLIGGGGGGGVSSSGYLGGGGGSAGYSNFIMTSVPLTANTAYTVSIGPGGPSNTNGTQSYFISTSYAAAGGNRGVGSTGASGGSGAGGGGGYSNDYVAGTGGSYGGNAIPGGSRSAAGGTGQGWTSCEFGQGTTAGCNAGVTPYGGGGSGGAGKNYAGSAGPQIAGGYNGGGAGGRNSVGVAGTANTGGGGGGGGYSGYAGGAGGSGIVVIRNHR